MKAYHATEEHKKAYRKRKVWVEPLFGEAQQWHGLKRFLLRGLEKVNCVHVMTATGQNLKRLVAARDWGGGTSQAECSDCTCFLAKLLGHKSA